MRIKLTLIRVWILGILLFSSNLLFAQQKMISGKVLNESTGQAVPNSTVVVRGSTVGTQTDANGNFKISVPGENSRLIISSVGFEPQDIIIGNKTDISISLKTTVSTLSEVVVTGYTSQRKKDITGAVTVVNVADLKSQPASDATSQLQGRASGVTVIQSGVPGAPATVRIRGLGSFNNNSPLYVVDGVQTGSIVGINPNDIESLQVLKDAASASVYGVRASNGVIIITTKKGRKKGINVAYDMYYGSQNPGKGLDLLNPQEAAELYFLARKNVGVATTGSVYGNGVTPVLPDYIYASGLPANGIPIMNGNPAVNPDLYRVDYGRLGDPDYSFNATFDPSLGYTPNKGYIIVPANKGGTDWFKEITRNAPIQNHNLSMSGANDNSRFLLSLNYFDQQAITKYQFYKRYTARMNSEFNILPQIRVGENLQVYSSEADAPGAGDNNDNTEASVISQTFRITSIVPVYTINPGDFAGNKGGPGVGTWGNASNPLAQLYRSRNNRNNNVNLFGNVYAEVDIARHFTVRSSFGGNLNTNNAFSYPYIQYENNENTARTTYSESFIRSNNWIWTNQITFKNSFGKHNVSALAGTEAQRGGGRQIIGNSTSFFSYNYNPFINLSNGSVQNLSGSNIYTPGSTVSYFAKADYSYDDKYLLSATVRRDGSSKFQDPNKYGTFPAFSLGWRISNETFMKNFTWLNDLKLRGSWGKLGNEAAANAANAYTTFASNRQSSWYDINGTQNAPQEGFFLSFVGNPLGKWETSITSNVGFDATLFSNTTSVVFDWYQKKTEDLLYNPAGQAIGGAVVANNPAFRNVGSMKNTGVDLLIDNKTNITRDLRLNTTLTFTTYNNKITSITDDGQKFFDFNSPINEANRIGASATRNFLGEALNTYYGYEVLGLWQKQSDIDALTSALRAKTPGDTTSVFQTDAAPGRFRYRDVNGDGKIDAEDRKIIGNPNPKFTYGINLGVEYKGFDVSAFFYGVSGKDAFNFTKWWTDFTPGTFPGGRSKAALYDSWLPDGSRPDAKTPVAELTSGTGFSDNAVVNSYYVEKASYFRLRNLQIGYTIPVAVSSKAKISKLRIYIQGTNLFTITKYTGINPDIQSTDDRSASIDIGSYPIVKQYLVGANVVF
ncbi:MAG: TonB-dependent receptor [Ginsengibacter sp.]